MHSVSLSYGILSTTSPLGSQLRSTRREGTIFWYTSSEYRRGGKTIASFCWVSSNSLQLAHPPLYHHGWRREWLESIREANTSGRKEWGRFDTCPHRCSRQCLRSTMGLILPCIKNEYDSANVGFKPVRSPYGLKFDSFLACYNSVSSALLTRLNLLFGTETHPSPIEDAFLLVRLCQLTSPSESTSFSFLAYTYTL